VSACIGRRRSRRGPEVVEQLAFEAAELLEALAPAGKGGDGARALSKQMLVALEAANAR
jgi:hypothetical protein